MDTERRRALWRTGELLLGLTGCALLAGAWLWTVSPRRPDAYTAALMALPLALFELSYRCWEKRWALDNALAEPAAPPPL
ncbi:hypothetical protein LG634_34990 [Streptomyces bambusae]|uniref:hypothetical protein n=1 Tax=Streptomyces bambusae TaxID=1550616 RepID=UPI001CFF7ED8|nr:hypothetical protein [Streptomyces bambusae]MCB5169996.1 hypothetical protein [Streptomyces bambusae]